MGEKERKDQNESINDHMRRGGRVEPQSDRIKKEVVDEANRDKK